MNGRPAHLPVLLGETIELLAPVQGETFADCTAGLGGHAVAIAALLGPGRGGGTVVLNDADPENLERAAARVREAARARVVPVRGNYVELPRVMEGMGLAADMVMADLGFSSSQMEDAARGMSFGREGPLDMRMDPTLPVTAAELVASLPEGELAGILREFGEEREARRIARKLVESRAARPITTTGQLAELVRSVVGRRPGSIDPATRTFQALRIAVNDELGSLDALLEAIARGARASREGRPSWLRPGARIAIISFHSLEDRRVKRALAGLAERGLATVLTRRPVQAGEEELARNVRARSAKLRGARLVG